jgi:hypothetical protein
MESIAEIVHGVLQATPEPPKEKPAPFITFPVSIGLLEGKHVEAMGSAIWCFLWCINRVTMDRIDSNGQRWGQVLGGCRFNHQRIADELGLTLRSVRYQMDRLKTAGYLRITRCQDGQQVEVRNSIKWLRRKTQPPQRGNKPSEKENPARSTQTSELPTKPQEPVMPETPAPQAGNEPTQVRSLAEALRKKQWEREQIAIKN